jgi:hypothetical protein
MLALAPRHTYSTMMHTNTHQHALPLAAGHPRVADFRGPGSSAAPAHCTQSAHAQPALLPSRSFPLSPCPMPACQPWRQLEPLPTDASLPTGDPLPSALPHNSTHTPLSSTCASVPSWPPAAASPRLSPLGTTPPHDATYPNTKRAKPNPMLPAALYPQLFLLLCMPCCCRLSLNNTQCAPAGQSRGKSRGCLANRMHSPVQLGQNLVCRQQGQGPGKVDGMPLP